MEREWSTSSHLGGLPSGMVYEAVRGCIEELYGVGESDDVAEQLFLGVATGGCRSQG
jgi:hypothetical protein